MADNIKVAVIQMVSTTEVKENIRRARALITEAKNEGARWVVLPEYWPLMGKSDKDKLKIKETLGKGAIQRFLRETARKLKLTLFAGSISLASEKRDKVYNSLLVVSPEGEILSRYDKSYLFELAGDEPYDETQTIARGTSLPPRLTVDGWEVGEGICYDLRFPEFFRRQLPFDVLILPAAFTYATGKAHWLTLLRARAIENQCYVAASAQGGWHQNGRRTFGHSVIIDPWGEVLASIPAGEGVITADLSLERLAEVRATLPALASYRELK